MANAKRPRASSDLTGEGRGGSSGSSSSSSVVATWGRIIATEDNRELDMLQQQVEGAAAGAPPLAERLGGLTTSNGSSSSSDGSSSGGSGAGRGAPKEKSLQRVSDLISLDTPARGRRGTTKAQLSKGPKAPKADAGGAEREHAGKVQQAPAKAK
jgi:hypothetical protein